MSSNIHHRRPRSKGGTTRWPRGNCVKVVARRHYFWHCLFGNMSGESIIEEINRLWIDPTCKIVGVKKEKLQ